MEIKPHRFIGVFLLALLNLAVMASLRNLPIVAEFGFGSAFFYLLVALFFLLPVALISAELATGWPKEGGVYVWVKEAFGTRWGFFAVWMQWIHNVTWFPAILSFSAATLAYLINPSLANCKIYLFLFILTTFWGFTLFNYFGFRNSSWFSACGVIAGTIVPGIFLIALGTLWVALGDPIQIPFSWEAFLPPMGDIQNIVFLTGLFLAFGGIEVSAAYVRDVEHPQKSYPMAILIAAFLSFLLYVLGALAIAIMIPKEQINLVKGLMEAFASFLAHFHIEWLLVPIGAMILIGALGETNAWIIGPVRALHATAKHGDLPPLFAKLNSHETPFALLCFQGGIVTLAAFVFLWMPTASGAFWILSAMSAQLYLVMYFLLLLSGIKLRHSHPHIERKYKVPGGKLGMWILGGVGALSSLFGFLVAFVPPKGLNVGNLLFYESFMILGVVLMCAIPFFIYHMCHPRSPL